MGISRPSDGLLWPSAADCISLPAVRTQVSGPLTLPVLLRLGDLWYVDEVGGIEARNGFDSPLERGGRRGPIDEAGVWQRAR